MAPKRMRRPAARPDRRRVMARPASEGPLGDGWVAAGEVDLRTLQEMKAVHIQGRYWDNEADIVGEITKTL